MTKNERLELCELSLKVYGKPYQWQKMVNKGEIAPQVEKMEDGTDRKYVGISYYSIEEIKKIMQELLAEEDELKLKEAQENEAKAQAAKIKEMAGETKEEVKETGQYVVKEIIETVGD